jgi:hypothetical protein
MLKEKQILWTVSMGIRPPRKPTLTKASKNTTNQRHLNLKKRTRMPDVAAAIVENRWVTVKSIALANGISVKTAHAILHKDLGLAKKSTRWVPWLLNSDQKQERVRTCHQFLAAVHGNVRQHCPCE